MALVFFFIYKDFYLSENKDLQAEKTKDYLLERNHTFLWGLLYYGLKSLPESEGNKAERSYSFSEEFVLLTNLQSSLGPRLVIVADALELASACELPGNKLESSPEKFAVEESEELCQGPRR